MSIIERAPRAVPVRTVAAQKALLLNRIWPPALAIAATIALWWLASSVLSQPYSLLRQTAPDKAFRAAMDLLNRGVLLQDAGISLWRLLIGLCLAALIGVPVGLLLGVSTTAERAARPVIQFLRMISPLSWTPIAVAV
ncbi:ABC transporter permease, partial [Mycobacteroides abscessus]